MNHYDSSKILNYLKLNNNIIVDNYIDSDLIILNTCTIRKKSEYKFFNFLEKLRILKNNNNNLIICVCGCLSTQEKENIFLRNNLVDIICGPQSIHKLNKLIYKFIKYKKKIIDIKSYKIDKNIINKKDFNFNNIKLNTYVSIMEGCNKFCSYCIVPFTRGSEVSRSPEKIIEEVCYLSKQNIYEINLLGQNVNSYSGIFSNGKLCSFSNLLNLISKIDNIKRIRFTTSNPFNFNNDIINSYKYIDKIVSYLHLPVQSGSNKILKLMNRKYSIEFYKELVNKILNVRPNMIFSTDFIVGFPGESEKDFLLTLDLINELKFDHSYIFMYSPRPGTKSYYMKDNVSLIEKKRRFKEIKNLIDNNIIYWNKKMLYNKYKILVEGFSKKNSKFLFGRTENNRKVYFLGDKNLLGKLIYIKINDISNKNYLYGNL